MHPSTRTPTPTISGRRATHPWPPGQSTATSRHFASSLAMAFALAAGLLLATTGCAVTRGQESVGAYVDDSAITTAVKARFIDNRLVDAASISVETMKGTVMLSGFAKNSTERSTAETLAWKVSGVVAVNNQISIRP